MQKLMQKHQKFLKGNAGFSLVELIIVIAIMAALIAILAPQYLKYVEKSRVSADRTQLDEVIKAVKVAASDPDVDDLGTANVTFTITNTNGTCVITGGTTKSLAVVTNTLGSATFYLKSTGGKTSATYSVVIAVASNTYEVTISGVPATINPTIVT